MDLYIKAGSSIDALQGKAFNIGGGINNSSSLLELFSFLNEKLDVELVYKKIQTRISDQKVFVSNLNKIKTFLDWEPKICKEDGLSKSLEWISRLLK